MAEVAERRIIQLIVDGSGVKRAVDEVNRNLQAVGSAAESIRNRLSGTFAGLIGAFGILEFTNTIASMEKLRAQLRTFTGDSAKAEEAFSALTAFAATTPFTLDQSVTAFNRLVSLGLDPSERSLRAFGNVASAMGKDLTDFIEAVADASVGEFERLKEFGIKASAQGNQVAFTFQGVTTTVGRDAKSIQNYLRDIGETKFGTAMQDQMATLGGSLSNLEDAFTQLVDTIGRAGAGSAISSVVQGLTSALTTLQSVITTGLGADIASNFLDQLGLKSSSTADLIAEKFGVSADGLREAFSETTRFLGQAFLNMPTNLKIALELMTVEFAAFFDQLPKNFEVFKTQFAGFLKDLDLGLKDIVTLGGASAERDKALQDTASKVREIEQRYKAQTDASNAALEASRNAALEEFNNQQKIGEGLRARLEAVNETAKANKTNADVLGQYGKQVEAASTAVQALTASEKERASLTKDLRTKGPAFSDSGAVAEALTSLNRAQSAITAGFGSDPEKAKQELDIFREQIKALTEKGKVSEYYAQTLADQASAIEKQIPSALKTPEVFDVPVQIGPKDFAAVARSQIEQMGATLREAIAGLGVVELPVNVAFTGPAAEAVLGADLFRREALKRGAPQ